MSLGDHYDPDNQYLQEGVHAVEVVEFEMFKYNTGNPGVKFVFRAIDGGGKTNKSFALSGKAPKVLAGFAAACGMTQEEMNVYSLTDNTGHQKLIGRKLKVRVVFDGKYHEVGDFGWFPIDANVIDRRLSPTATQEQTPPSDTPF